jgi:hypothetical protein
MLRRAIVFGIAAMALALVPATASAFERGDHLLASGDDVTMRSGPCRGCETVTLTNTGRYGQKATRPSGRQRTLSRRSATLRLASRQVLNALRNRAGAVTDVRGRRLIRYPVRIRSAQVRNGHLVLVVRRTGKATALGIHAKVKPRPTVVAALAPDDNGPPGDLFFPLSRNVSARVTWWYQERKAIVILLYRDMFLEGDILDANHLEWAYTGDPRPDLPNVRVITARATLTLPTPSRPGLVTLDATWLDPLTELHAFAGPIAKLLYDHDS